LERERERERGRGIKIEMRTIADTWEGGRERKEREIREDQTRPTLVSSFLNVVEGEERAY